MFITLNDFMPSNRFKDIGELMESSYTNPFSTVSGIDELST